MPFPLSTFKESFTYIYFFTKKIDEISEIKKKNIAISIVIAILVLSAALLVEHGLSILLNSLVKYPEVGRGLLDITNFK